MKLSEFEAGLRAVLPQNGRPFICEGSPLGRPIFLVGFNPANEIQADFWSFWRDDYGFEKARWFEAYKKENATKPPRPGRTRRFIVSPTRERLNAFVNGAAPVPVLETNVFSKASDDIPSLAKTHRNAAPFRYLLETLKPSILVVLGQEAQDAVRALRPTAEVVEKHHFARRWKVAAAEELGAEQARKIVGAG